MSSLWGKMLMVNVEETHFLVGSIEINLATPTTQCGVERVFFLKLVLHLSPLSKRTKIKLVSIETFI